VVHTPDQAVDAAMNLCRLTSSDVLLDVGCGDGRVLLAAAARGAHAIGIDVDRACLARSRAAAEHSGLSHLIEVAKHDFMSLEEHAAYGRVTVLFLFLTRR
jgi:cyclopropane fatty-acyl-phospholipid synthase-like methyltransferase